MAWSSLFAEKDAGLEHGFGVFGDLVLLAEVYLICLLSRKEIGKKIVKT